MRIDDITDPEDKELANRLSEFAGTGVTLSKDELKEAEASIGHHSWLLTLTDNEGNTLLHKATETENINFCRLLIRHGANSDAQNNSKDTALHIAARKHATPLCDLLLKNDANPNASNAQGDTPLHECQLVGVCRLLLMYGADSNIKNNNQESPKAASNGTLLMASNNLLIGFNNLAIKRIPVENDLIQGNGNSTDLVLYACALGKFWQHIGKPLLESGKPTDRMLFNKVMEVLPPAWKARMFHQNAFLERMYSLQAFDPMALNSAER